MSNFLKVAGMTVLIVGLATDCIKSLCITSAIGIVLFLIGYYLEYKSQRFQDAVNAEVNRRIRENMYEER